MLLKMKLNNKNTFIYLFLYLDSLLKKLENEEYLTIRLQKI